MGDLDLFMSNWATDPKQPMIQRCAKSRVSAKFEKENQRARSSALLHENKRKKCTSARFLVLFLDLGETLLFCTLSFFFAAWALWHEFKLPTFEEVIHQAASL